MNPASELNTKSTLCFPESEFIVFAVMPPFQGKLFEHTFTTFFWNIATVSFFSPRMYLMLGRKLLFLSNNVKYYPQK